MNIIVPAQAQATKPNDASVSSDSPNSFNQVLSREMADRKSVEEAPKTKEPDAKDAAKPPASAKADEAKASGDSDTSAADGNAATDAQADAATATNDMLALVASLNQLNPASQTTAQAVVPGQAVAKDAAELGIDAATSKGKPVIEAAGTARGRATLDHAVTSGTQAKPQAAASSLPATAQAQPAQAGDKPDTQNFAGAMDKASAQADDTRDAAAAKKPVDVSATPAKSSQEMAAASKEAVAAATAKTEHMGDAKEIPAPPVALQAQQQPAVNNLTHVAAAAQQASESLAPRVGTPAWDQALGQKVTWMIAGEQQSASLTLNPPDLGPLQVVLNVTNSQANATFVAAQPEVRQALEAAMPRLRDMLSDAGIQLGQATVNAGSGGQQSAFEQQQQSPSGSRRTDIPGVRFDTPMPTSRVQSSSSGQGLVDTFV